MSETPVENVAAKLNLQFDAAPPFGAGSMPVEKEQSFVMLAHFFSFIIWLWKRGESPAIDAHGKEATNFAITVFICVFPLAFLSSFLSGFLSTLIYLIVVIVQLAVLGLVIIGMIKAKEGKILRYPVNFRLIK